MNTASVWYPNYKKIRHKTLTSSSFASYSPVVVSLVRLQEQSANIFGLHFPLNLFSISEMSHCHFSMFIGDDSHVYRKKIEMGMQKTKLK
jgi:CRISPR/Cas system endoribonuclease Cas6 (RAMP superfamily)